MRRGALGLGAIAVAAAIPVAWPEPVAAILLGVCLLAQFTLLLLTLLDVLARPARREAVAPGISRLALFIWRLSGLLVVPAGMAWMWRARSNSAPSPFARPRCRHSSPVLDARCS